MIYQGKVFCIKVISSINFLSIMSKTKPRVVFVLGAPGSGKGTQCEKIVEVSFYIGAFNIC